MNPPSVTYSANEPARRPIGVPLAITLLAISLALFFMTQIGNSVQQNEAIRWQIATGERQIEAAKAGQTQLAELMKQQDTLVNQSTQVQAQYQKLLDDLLKLSEEDEDTRKIVEKWKIQRSASGKAAPADAAAAEKK